MNDRPEHDHEPGHDAEHPVEDDQWVLNSAIGAAAMFARAASGVAHNIGSSTPGRIAEGAARRLTQPLNRTGERVREQVEAGAGPAAQDVVRRVSPGVVDAVDLNAILGAIDVQAIVDRIDVSQLVAKVDVGSIVDRIDVDALVSKIDVQAIVDRIDVNALVSKIDVQAIVERIDLDALLADVDLNALLQRIDLDALLDELDVDEVVGRIDVDELIAKIDMDALVANTELGVIVARSTSTVASGALDAVRSQGVAVDNLVARVADRLMRRDPAAMPSGPPLLVRPALEAGPTPSAPSALEAASASSQASEDAVS